MNEKQILNLLDSPEKALKLNDEQLDETMLAAVKYYGLTVKPELVEKLMRLYQHYVTRIHPAQRLLNYQKTVDLVISKELGAHALIPYLCCDPARPIVSTAALDYVVLAPTSEENAVVGANELLDLYERGAFVNGLAILGGIMMSGDRRLIAVIKDSCRELSCEEIELLIKCRGNLLTAAVAEFYLEWLETIDSVNDCDRFAAVAAGLANLAIAATNEAVATDTIVYDIERVFPSTPENAIRINKQWLLSEYAEGMSSRLREIAKKEQGEPVTPEVMSIWGIA